MTGIIAPIAATLALNLSAATTTSISEPMPEAQAETIDTSKAEARRGGSQSANRGGQGANRGGDSRHHAAPSSANSSRPAASANSGRAATATRSAPAATRSSTAARAAGAQRATTNSNATAARTATRSNGSRASAASSHVRAANPANAPGRSTSRAAAAHNNHARAAADRNAQQRAAAARTTAQRRAAAARTTAQRRSAARRAAARSAPWRWRSWRPNRRAHWYHGVFVYGPAPRHHHRHNTAVARGGGGSTQMPDRAVDRNGSFGVGINTGTYLSAYDDGGAFSDWGIGANLELRPVESVGFELNYEYHDETFDSESERITNLLQPNVNLYATPWNRFSPYASAGLTLAGRSYSDTWYDGWEYRHEEIESTAFGPNVGLGFQVAMGKSAALDLNARYTAYLNTGDDAGVPSALQGNAGLNFYF